MSTTSPSNAGESTYRRLSCLLQAFTWLIDQLHAFLDLKVSDPKVFAVGSSMEVRDAINDFWQPQQQRGPGWKALKTIKQLGIDYSGGTSASKPVFEGRNSKLNV